MIFLGNSIFSYLYIFIVIVFSILIILERRKPEKTIAWIMIFIIFLPLGIILYIFLGRNWKKRKLKKDFSPNIKHLIEKSTEKINRDEYKSIIKLLAANSDSPLFINNKITLFRDGSEKFECLKEELIKAKHHIHLEYYIVKNDTIGNEIKDILIKKACEGVSIRFIIDRVGSSSLSKKYKKSLKDAGIEVIEYSYFLTPFLKFINTQINYRNHRKIVVIDGKVGFIGGNNIGDEYLGKSSHGYWRDSHIMIKGDFVLGLQCVFLDDYFTIKKANDEELLYENTFQKYFPPPANKNNQIIQLVKSGPNSNFPSIMHLMIKMISMADNNIYITTPYFVPSESLMESLKIASLSGVDVKILFPGKYDHFIVYYASKAYLSELLKCGVKVYLFSPKSFIHAKVISIDGKICTLGTANVDIRSFELNYEINAVIYDDNFTKEIDNMFNEDLKYSKELTLKEYENSSIFTKVTEAFMKLFSSLL